MTTVEVDVGGQVVKLSNLEKILWPDAGFTKGDMIRYYSQLAGVIVPYIADRPLTLARFPDGVGGNGWFQANCNRSPAWLRTCRIESTLVPGKVMHYCVVDDAASLLWVANQASIELHPFLATCTDIERPAVLAVDLDPGPPADLATCCRVAMLLRDVLDAAGLRAWPKTSGSKGLQLYVPLNTEVTYAQTKPFARAIAALLAREHPDVVVDRPDKSIRAGKVFIDWSQNDATKSMIAPYSLRARAYPTVSTPVTWEEVDVCADVGDPGRLTFLPADVIDRLDEVGDLFAPVLTTQQDLRQTGPA
jgi:bifunctional non-homologous end joining protein LigD